MGTKVQLPPGCSGITCEDGTRYSGKRGGFVEVEDRHAAAIQKDVGPAARMLTAQFAVSIGTRRGRWCSRCARLWQAWSVTCPKCGEETELR